MTNTKFPRHVCIKHDIAHFELKLSKTAITIHIDFHSPTSGENGIPSHILLLSHASLLKALVLLYKSRDESLSVDYFP